MADTGAANSAYTVSGSSIYNNTNTVDTSGVTAATPAPQAVYQSERFGSSFTYIINNLNVGATYTVRLHFAEIYWSKAGSRVFNVSINGTPVLTSFDIYASAGGANKAIVKSFTTTANSSGNITISYSTVTDNAKSSGIEILG